MADNTEQPFRVGILVDEGEHGKIVTDRVVLRNHTYDSRDRQKRQAHLRTHEYRKKLLKGLQHGCTDGQDVTILLGQFLNVTETIFKKQAIAFLVDGVAYEKYGVPSFQALGTEFLNGYRSLTQHPEMINSGLASETILHPLIIASIAFCLGGPVNAANTAVAHKWRAPPEMTPVHEIPHFHTEGDNGDIFNDHCVALVWEAYEKGVAGPSGDHNIFFSGTVEPHQLVCGNAESIQYAPTPVLIMYNARNALLMYDRPLPQAERNSIALNFHRHTMDDDMAALLYPREVFTGSQETSLAKLVTSTPTFKYEEHFHRLLFSPKSVQAIFEMLSAMNIDRPPDLPTNAEGMPKQPEKDYQEDLVRHTPLSVLGLRQDVRMSGPYNRRSVFFENVLLKLRRDLHVGLGRDMIPYEKADDTREVARTFIRDLPDKTINRRFTFHTRTLLDSPFTAKDLATTSQLVDIAKWMELRYLELVATGYIDKSSIMPCIPPFLCALGQAIDGPKLADIMTELWIHKVDLDIIGARCLYLFWCADWLFDYLSRPIKGQCMVSVPKRGEMPKLRKEVEQRAKFLFRNWVAWGIFVEGLPHDSFYVTQPAESPKAS